MWFVSDGRGGRGATGCVSVLYEWLIINITINDEDIIKHVNTV